LILINKQLLNVFNNVILARNRQLPDDYRMIETCRSIFKSFNINNLSVCIGWCADQVALRSARCNDKEEIHEVLALNWGDIGHSYSNVIQGVPLPLASDVAFGFETPLWENRQ